MQNLFPETSKRFYHSGTWYKSMDWVAETGGNLDRLDVRCYIVFSTRFLKIDNSNWNLFSVSVSRFGDTVILNDFYDLKEFRFDPNVFDVAQFAEANEYLHSKNMGRIFFFSNVENHKELTNRIIKVLKKRSTLKPLSEYSGNL